MDNKKSVSMTELSPSNGTFESKAFARLPVIRDRDFRQRTRQLNRSLDDFKRFFLANNTSGDSDWSIDPLPMIIGLSEWRNLEMAVLQRFKVFNRFIDDIYGENKILSERVLPASIPFSDPSFLLPAVGKLNELSDPYIPSVPFASIDLVKDQNGRWLVVDQNFDIPDGLSRLIQARRLVAQYFPEYFHAIQPESISGKPASLMERLRYYGHLLSGDDEPLVVLLSEITTENQSFEDGFLARFMGVPVVEANDLVVREQGLYLRTIEGLKRVHVILRRSNDLEIDPVSFGHSHHGGIPGLIHAVKAGKVFLFNRLGSAVANNRNLLAFEHSIFKFYGESYPLASCIPTFYTEDVDQSEQLRMNPSAFYFRDTYPTNSLDFFGPKENVEDPLDSESSPVVGHPRLNFSTVPVFDGKEWAKVVCRIRLFIMGGEHPEVVKGGILLGQLESPENDLAFHPNTIVMRDIWIEKSKKESEQEALLEPLESKLDLSLFPLSSRLAENLYWLARYVERSENAARITKVYVEAMRDDRDDANSSFLDRCLDSLNWINLEGSAPIKDPIRKATSILSSEKNQGSVYNNLKEANNLCIQLSGSVTPEYFRALAKTRLLLDSINGRKRIHPVEIESLSTGIIDDLGSVSGCADRTFSRDDGWFFYKGGIMIERTISTLNLLIAIMPTAGAVYQRHRLDDSDLIYLLRMATSLDAYNRAYRSRAFLDRIVNMLVKSPVAPGGIKRCLNEFFEDLNRTHSSDRSQIFRPIRRLLDDIFDLIDNFNVENHLKWREFGRGSMDLGEDRGISTLVDELILIRNGVEKLHYELESKYFHHQEKGTK